MITTDEGEPAISLDAVLEDPPERGAAWPIDPLFGLIDAVNDYARTTEHAMFVYLFPTAESDLAA